MTDESTFLAEERCELITQRLAPFAIGWLGALGIWLLAFAAEGRLTAVAVIVVVLQAVILAAALVLCRAAPVAPRVVPVVVAASVLLGLAATVLVDAVGAHGEILAFMLLTLYLATALLFSWGWRPELALLVLTLVPWMLVFGRFAFFVPLGELAAAVAIGATLALAIAEGTARNVRAVLRRRRAQEEASRELQISRDAYRDIAEHARDMIWSADLQGRLTYVNEAMMAFVGLLEVEILGRSADDFYTNNPANPDFTAMAVRALEGEILPPITVECATPRGPRWVEVVSSIVYDQHGAPVGFRGISRDIQARRQAEAELRESEERFRSAFEDAAIGMGVTTMDGIVIRANRAFSDMLGCAEHGLSGRALYDLVHPEDREALQHDQGRLRHGAAQTYRSERRYLRADGAVIWAVATASVVRDPDGKPLYVIGQLQDVTERRLAEEALKGSLQELRGSEEKLRLLAQRQVAIREEERKRLGFNLHDDVCQELVGVGILVESLHRTLAPMPAERAAEFDRVVGYLGEVVEHLRVLAHELRPLLLRDLGLDGSLRSLAEGMSSATLQVVTDFEGTIPRLDEEAEVSVYRIAQEALANATRHADARRVVVGLAVRDGMLHLQVSDDGRGFDPVVRPVMALGLASMEERALALGGRFETQSAPGRGTTVVFACPLEVRGADPLREPAAPSPTRSSFPPSTTSTPRSAARD